MQMPGAAGVQDQAGEARGLAGGQTYRGGTGSRVAGGRKRAWRRRCKRQDQITPSATNSTRALHIGQLIGNWGIDRCRIAGGPVVGIQG
ncbi:Uncharacterised protein [Pseudomonas aeruginosa]|nr:Uncharacterised protein [Pseudomonas aeruginosa]